MAKLTPEMELFVRSEKLKKQLMKQGMTKLEALKTIQKDLASKLPDSYVVGIDGGHISIRRLTPFVQNGVITEAGKQRAQQAIANIKGATKTFLDKEETKNGI